MRKDKKNFQGKIFFTLMLLCILFEKRGSDSISAYGSPEVSMPTGTINNSLSAEPSQVNNQPSMPVITTQEPKNEFQWSDPIIAGRQIYPESQRFNWYRRKILSEKTFAVYNNIVTVITNIIKSVNLFKGKVTEIEQLNNDFQKNIQDKMKLFGTDIDSFIKIGQLINDIEKRFITCKESHLYLNNKDFRKKIDREAQTIANIRLMLNNIEENKGAFENAYYTVTNSVKDLEHIKEEAKSFEELAWNKYQQLDELINDQNANKNFLEVTNIFDNLTNYNFYIRNTFLQFFNQGLSNLSRGNDAILALCDDFFQKYQATSNLVNAFSLEIQEDISREKEKLFQEQEKIRMAEEEAAASALKKKLALEKEKNKLPWYALLLEKGNVYVKDVFYLSKSYFIKFIEKLSLYYNIIFNKFSDNNSNIKKHNPIVSNNQQTVIAENLPTILPQTTTTPEIIILPSPVSHAGPQDKISQPILPEAPVINNNINNATENVFENTNNNVIIPKEQEKRGSSSYPAKPLEIKQQLGNDVSSLQTLPSIIASEEITPFEQTSANEGLKDQINSDKFTYKEALIKDQERKDLVNPIIDLSALEKNIGVGNRSALAIASPTIAAMEVGPEREGFRKSQNNQKGEREKTRNTNTKKSTKKKKKKKKKK